MGTQPAPQNIIVNVFFDTSLFFFPTDFYLVLLTTSQNSPSASQKRPRHTPNMFQPRPPNIHPSLPTISRTCPNNLVYILTTTQQFLGGFFLLLLLNLIIYLILYIYVYCCWAQCTTYPPSRLCAVTLSNKSIYKIQAKPVGCRRGCLLLLRFFGCSRTRILMTPL